MNSLRVNQAVRLKGPDFPMGIETGSWQLIVIQNGQRLKGPDFPMGIETTYRLR